MNYDITNPKSIEKYAKKLLERSLRDVLGNEVEQKYSGKGKLGQLLEDAYFGYKPNSKSQADFPEAGVELKTSPLKQSKKGLKAKERLVFNIIDFMEEYKNTFESSSFWKKNKLLLLMFYLHEKEKLDIDFVFKIIRLWEFPENDLKIIKDDWQKIINKIKAGKAHEISEGDTFYLGACTKGANKDSLRKQPYDSIPAMQRAFSLKTKYLNFIIEKSLNERKIEEEFEAVIKDKTQYNKKETFEDYVIKKFKPFYGKTDDEICKELKVKKSSAKSKYYLISKAILGVTKNKIEEFEKADIEMKTIRLEQSGKLKESMSFSQIKFKEIVNEEWEGSYWFTTLTKRFFFVVFQKDDNGNLRLSRVMFWTMPNKDLELAKKFWEDTKNKILKDDYEHFVKLSDNMICHVRPKGVNSNDKMETPSGRMEKKKCYWLNSSYIKEILK